MYSILFIRDGIKELSAVAYALVGNSVTVEFVVEVLRVEVTDEGSDDVGGGGFEFSDDELLVLAPV